MVAAGASTSDSGAGNSPLRRHFAAMDPNCMPPGAIAAADARAIGSAGRRHLAVRYLHEAS